MEFLVLTAARSLGDGNPLVFPNRRGNRIKDTFLSELLRNLNIAAVPHGFRSSFRDWAAEMTDHPREVIEAALAHVVQNKVEAAYARSDLFERRLLLMDDWATYLDGHAAAIRAGRRTVTGSIPTSRMERFAGSAPRDGCDSDTPIAPQNRRFSGGRSRHYGRRNRVRPILTEGAIRPAKTGRSGATPGPARCDSGCDRGALTESRAGAANSGCFGPSNERFEAGYSDTGCDGSGLSSSFNSLPGLK